MIDKKTTLIIGDDVYNLNPKLFKDFKSFEYQSFFIDEFGLKRTMDYWSGDQFFGNYMEIFYFFGTKFINKEGLIFKGFKIFK